MSTFLGPPRAKLLPSSHSDDEVSSAEVSSAVVVESVDDTSLNRSERSTSLLASESTLSQQARSARLIDSLSLAGIISSAGRRTRPAKLPKQVLRGRVALGTPTSPLRELSLWTEDKHPDDNRDIPDSAAVACGESGTVAALGEWSAAGGSLSSAEGSGSDRGARRDGEAAGASRYARASAGKEASRAQPQLRIDVHVSRLGLTVIDEEPREVLYLALLELDCRLKLSATQVGFDLSVGHLQLDSQLPSAPKTPAQIDAGASAEWCKFPVMLVPSGSSGSRGEPTLSVKATVDPSYDQVPSHRPPPCPSELPLSAK
eukprot:6510923-Prymnesium_polylepis.1